MATARTAVKGNNNLDGEGDGNVNGVFDLTLDSSVFKHGGRV